MKLILHIGAHRTGTTTFQSYLARNAALLRMQAVACWGPQMTRKGMFAGIQNSTPVGRRGAMGRARGRLKLRMHEAQWDRGAHTLLVCEENMMGSMARNLRQRTLYDDVGERLARYVAAFDHQVDEVVINIRALDHYWCSVAAYNVLRGHSVPSRDALAIIARTRRSWRDVITDIACAAPDARVRVLPFERFVGRSDAQLAAILRCDVPGDAGVHWLNRRPRLDQLRTALDERGTEAHVLRGPGDRWNPFLRSEIAEMREAYADDMFWLTAGADGLAELTEDLDRTEAQWPVGPLMRGQNDDIEERRMAQPR